MIDESFVISRAHLFPCMPHTKHSWKAVRPKSKAKQSKANETDAVSGKNHIQVGILGLSIEIERSSKPTIHGGRLLPPAFVFVGPAALTSALRRNERPRLVPIAGPTATCSVPSPSPSPSPSFPDHVQPRRATTAVHCRSRGLGSLSSFRQCRIACRTAEAFMVMHHSYPPSPPHQTLHNDCCSAPYI